MKIHWFWTRSRLQKSLPPAGFMITLRSDVHNLTGRLAMLQHNKSLARKNPGRYSCRWSCMGLSPESLRRIKLFCQRSKEQQTRGVYNWYTRIPGHLKDTGVYWMKCDTVSLSDSVGFGVGKGILTSLSRQFKPERKMSFLLSLYTPILACRIQAAL